jgi:hypothetical protein
MEYPGSSNSVQYLRKYNDYRAARNDSVAALEEIVDRHRGKPPAQLPFTRAAGMQRPAPPAPARAAREPEPTLAAAQPVAAEVQRACRFSEEEALVATLVLLGVEAPLDSLLTHLEEMVAALQNGRDAAPSVVGVIDANAEIRSQADAVLELAAKPEFAAQRKVFEDLAAKLQQLAAANLDQKADYIGDMAEAWGAAQDALLCE